MAWFKVDDRLWAHPKWAQLGAEARALWVTAGSYCAQYETDGTVFPHVLPSLVTGKNLKRPATELVNAGLWEEHSGAYVFKDWEQYQPTKAQQQAKREQDRERKARWRSRQESRRDSERSPGRVRASRPDPTRPDLYKETNHYVVSEENPAEPKTGKAKKTGKRATELPHDWQPKETHQTKAFNLGVNWAWEADKFRNHHGARGTTFKDWDKAFHMWITKAAEYADRDGGYHAPAGSGLSVVTSTATPPGDPVAANVRKAMEANGGMWDYPPGLSDTARARFRQEYRAEAGRHGNHALAQALASAVVANN